LYFVILKGSIIDKFFVNHGLLMDKSDNIIHPRPLVIDQKNNDRNNNIILKDNAALRRQLTTVKIHNKIKVIKVFLSIILLFSATAIISVSGQSQSAYAISFKSTKNLSNNDGDSNNPQIEVSGSNVYAVWGDASKGGGDTLFRKSSDAGNTFQSILDLSNNKAGEATEQHIVKEGNNVYVVWSEDGDVFFKRSTNNGASFGSTVNLSNDDKTSDTPDIAVTGGNVYVVWTNREETGGNDQEQLFFKRSTDNGQTFGSVKKISDVFIEAHSRIAAVGSNVYVAFGAGGDDDQDLYFTRSTNEGNSFSSAVKISNSEDATNFGGIAAKGNNVYIAWWNNPENQVENHVEFKRSTDNGASFGSTKDFGLGINPQLDIISNNVYVVWQSDNGISFKASKDNGASFGGTKILSNSGENPQISSSGTAVRVVWSQSVSGNNEILFRASSSEGSSLGSVKNLSNNDGDSIDPQIVSSGGSVYVVWSDNTPGNYDILFKKGVD
jgi:hypothetical protein